MLAASDSAEDKEAAASYATLWNRLFSDPVLRGSYPVGFDALMPGPVEDDLRTIGTPVDFYGVNYYNPTRVAGPSTPRRRTRPNGSTGCRSWCSRSRGTRAPTSAGRWCPAACGTCW